MKSLPNVLRLVVLNPPVGVDPRLESKGGSEVGKREGNRVTFETSYVCKQEVTGPAFKVEGERRWSVYVGWYDIAERRVGRLKVPLDAVPTLAWDCEIVVEGSDAGEPARGVASVVRARNVEDYL